MSEMPLILFPDPIPVDKTQRHGGNKQFHSPLHQRQVDRLSPMFSTLQKAIDNGRVKIAQNPDGIVPEYTLVLEVADNPVGFETAVRNLNAEGEDVEWLFEVVDNNVENNDDFYRIKNSKRDNTKKMSFKYFCILTNQRALEEICSLWENFRKDEKCTFPHGKSGLKKVFATLSDIHLWGVKERLEETDILSVWEDELKNPDNEVIKCEIELFFRHSVSKRPENDGKGNAIMITNLDEDRKYWKQPLLDLCPECMDEFEKWMKAGGTP